MNFRPPNTPRAREAGSTIVTGLTIMALATLGITAWISLIGARSIYIEGMETTMKRRLALMNARSATKEFLYRNVLTKSINNGTVINLPDGSASITVPALPQPTFSSVVRPGGVVRTGPSDGFGYFVEMTVDMAIKVDHDDDPGTATIDTQHVVDFHLKSRSQALAGELVTMYKPGLTPSVGNNLEGSIEIAGRTMLYAAEAPHSVDDDPMSGAYSTYTAADPFSTEKIRSLGGAWQSQSDFASVPQTTGDFLLSNGYQGTLDQIDPAGDPAWSTKNKIESDSHITINGATAFNSGRGAVSDGNGTVEIELGNFYLPNIIVGNGTKVLRLVGQSTDIGFTIAGFRKAVAVLVLQTSDVDDLEQIHFVNRNNRRIGLMLKKTGDWSQVDLTFDNADLNPTWRLLLVSENVRMRRNGGPAGRVDMMGGIATDRDFKWGSDASRVLSVRRDTDPKYLERLAPRTAWIEAYAD